MKLNVKIVSILDGTKAVKYGFSSVEIFNCIGREITVEIPNTPYVKGERHIVNDFLPTNDSLRHSQQICKMEVEVI